MAYNDSVYRYCSCLLVIIIHKIVNQPKVQTTKHNLKLKPSLILYAIALFLKNNSLRREYYM